MIVWLRNVFNYINIYSRSLVLTISLLLMLLHFCMKIWYIFKEWRLLYQCNVRKTNCLRLGPMEQEIRGASQSYSFVMM